MRSFFAKTPSLFRWLYPNRLWKIQDSESVYLTFDDGPTPEVTDWVLDQLEQYRAKATFFCIGKNIAQHPEIFQRLKSKGHRRANHTFNHINGWKTNVSAYLDNTEKTSKFFDSEQQLFRPPYGKIKSSQAKQLQAKGYKIVMWDVLSFDFDTSISKEQCLQYAMKGIEPGSIVVFHDSKKAEENLRYALPKVLEYISEKGWECKAL